MSAPPPLSGVAVSAPEAPGPEREVAADLLTGLGARLEGSGAGPVARLEPAPVCARTGPTAAGVPGGTLSYARALALAGGALAARRVGSDVTVGALDVAVQVFLPQVMAASYGAPRWPEPPTPRRFPGGFLNCELGAPGDEERFAALLATLPAGTPAGDVAAAAQEWRLPVCPYRPLPPGGIDPGHPVAVGDPDGARPGPGRPGPHSRAEPPAQRPGAGAAPPDGPLGGISVCDLTAMWAGPLATWLLGRLGATVWKVEPTVRPDGLRALGGGGIHPGGVSRDPGRDSALFNALNSGKTRLDLDLSTPRGGRDLLEVVAASDVVIDSFSPRVMPNLGLTPADLRRVRPDLVTASVPAFGPGPLRSWVAYGTGAHALSGLGDLGAGCCAAPAVTYPDPLAGLAAALAVLAGLVAREAGWRPAHLEVALLSVLAPLTRPPLRPPGPVSRLVAERDPGLGRGLWEEGSRDGRFAPLGPGSPDAVAPLGHPLGPWRGPAVGEVLGSVP